MAEISPLRMNGGAAGRRRELDLLRTLAIVLMIVYHAAYDGSAFHQWNIDVLRGGWKALQLLTASLFLLLVGMSAALSEHAMQSSAVDTPLRWHKRLARACWIGSAALGVSAATWLFHEETFVRFGVLHLIALSAILLPLFRKLRGYAALLGLLILFMEPLMRNTTASSPLLLPLGLHPPSFRTIDYFPLIPWFGVILIGFALGHMLYVGSPRWKMVPPFQEHPHPILTALAWPGRHALIIYLLHQPVLLTILAIMHR